MGLKSFIKKNLPESGAGKAALAVATGGVSLIPTIASEAGNALERLDGSKAIDSAQKKQEAAALTSNQLYKEMYDTTRADFEPYREFGSSRLNQLGSFIDQGVDYSGLPEVGNYEESEALKFTRDQGNDAILKAAGAIGTSGGTLKELEQFKQGVNSQYVNEEFNRQMAQRNQLFNEITSKRGNRLNELTYATGVGQNAAAKIGNANQAYAGNVSANTIGLANAQGSAEIAKSNNRNQLIMGGASLLGGSL